MEPRITVITHNHLSDAGRAPRALQKAGALVTQWDMQTQKEMPSFESYDGLVILGGPMRSSETTDYPWLIDEMREIKECLDQNKPVLGVCLGAQMICELKGGQVRLASFPERQYVYARKTNHDALMKNVPDLLPLYLMHSDTMVLPFEAEEFLIGGQCPQGVKFGEFAWGVQFHPEATIRLTKYWHDRLQNLLKEIGTSKQQQNRHYLRHAFSNAKTGRIIFKNFVDIVQSKVSIDQSIN
jgi:GMP synthase-like glutamine amidotransferase